MRKGIYSSDSYPVYVAGYLAAWLADSEDWVLYFCRNRGCWTTEIHKAQIEEIVVDEEMFSW